MFVFDYIENMAINTNITIMPIKGKAKIIMDLTHIRTTVDHHDTVERDRLI
jgi:hypothetical protein